MGHNEVEIYQILRQGITLSCPKFPTVVGLRLILLGILGLELRISGFGLYLGMKQYWD